MKIAFGRLLVGLVLGALVVAGCSSSGDAKGVDDYRTLMLEGAHGSGPVLDSDVTVSIQTCTLGWATTNDLSTVWVDELHTRYASYPAFQSGEEGGNFTPTVVKEAAIDWYKRNCGEFPAVELCQYAKGTGVYAPAGSAPGTDPCAEPGGSGVGTDTDRLRTDRAYQVLQLTGDTLTPIEVAEMATWAQDSGVACLIIKHPKAPENAYRTLAERWSTEGDPLEEDARVGRCFLAQPRTPDAAIDTLYWFSYGPIHKAFAKERKERGLGK